MVSSISYPRSSRNAVDEPSGRSSSTRAEKSMPAAILSPNSKKVLYALFLTAVFTTPVKASASKNKKYHWPCRHFLGWKKKNTLNGIKHTREYCTNQKEGPNSEACPECIDRIVLKKKKERQQDNEAKQRSIAYSAKKRQSKRAFRVKQKSMLALWCKGTNVYVNLSDLKEKVSKKLAENYVYGTGKIISKKPKEQRCTQTGVKLYYVDVELDVYNKDGSINANKKYEARYPVLDAGYIELVDEESIEQKRLDAVKIGSGILERVEVKDLDGHYNDHDDDMSGDSETVEEVLSRMKELGIDCTQMTKDAADSSGSSDPTGVPVGGGPLGSVPCPEADRSERRRMLVNRLIAAEMN